MGREMGPNALENYLETKSVVTQLASPGDRADRGGPRAEVRDGANTQRAPPRPGLRSPAWARGTRRVNYRETEHLRVLIANERKDRLALVAPIVVALGHEVIAREIESPTSAP